MPITHIFFDLHGTLVHTARLAPCFAESIGHMMAGYYGGQPQDWAKAYQHIQADWTSYFADLHLGGDEGLANLREGLYRTTRALFRLMHVKEPSQPQLMELAIQLAENAPSHCKDVFYEDVQACLQALHAQHYQLGICSYALAQQARSLLMRAGLMTYFTGPIIGPDVAERFEKSTQFYEAAVRLAGTSSQYCLAVDDSLSDLSSAHQVGMMTAHLDRPGMHPSANADVYKADLILGDNLHSLINAMHSHAL